APLPRSITVSRVLTEIRRTRVPSIDASVPGLPDGVNHVRGHGRPQTPVEASAWFAASAPPDRPRGDRGTARRRDRAFKGGLQRPKRGSGERDARRGRRLGGEASRPFQKLWDGL